MLLCAPTWVLCAETTSSEPRVAVLVLRSGGTMRGVVAQAADRYIVQFDATNEARVPLHEVAYVCRDLEEAYRCKLEESGAGVEARLNLARWCFENGLFARAADQLLAIEAQYGPQSQSEWLHQQLLQVASRGNAAAKPADAPPVPRAPLLDVAGRLRDLPEDAVVDFTRTVQPLLLNRCATSGCHGPQGKSAYLLLRPPGNGPITRRLTERNIAASLSFIDRGAPQQSRLLEFARTAHGGRNVPPVASNEPVSYEALENWMRSIAKSAELAKPRNIGEPNELLFQPAPTTPSVSPAAAMEDDAAPMTPKSMSTVTPTDAQDMDYRPRDPFDAEVFNRRYHRAVPSSQ